MQQLWAPEQIDPRFAEHDTIPEELFEEDEEYE